MTQAPAAPAKKAKLPREEDPRNPNFRLAAFFDEGTLELITEDDGSGMLAAVGKVNGTHVVAFCSDATVMGGAMGEVGCKAVVHAYERALADRAPIVGLWHSGGARLAEGVLSLHAVGEIFHAMTQASGKIPQICMVSEVEEHWAPPAQHTNEPGVLVVDLQGSVGREGADERVRL